MKRILYIGAMVAIALSPMYYDRSYVLRSYPHTLQPEDAPQPPPLKLKRRPGRCTPSASGTCQACTTCSACTWCNTHPDNHCSGCRDTNKKRG